MAKQVRIKRKANAKRAGRETLIDSAVLLWRKRRKQKGVCATKPKQPTESERLLAVFGDKDE